jgi:hypothetical protein
MKRSVREHACTCGACERARTWLPPAEHELAKVRVASEAPRHDTTTSVADKEHGAWHQSMNGGEMRLSSKMPADEKLT